MKKLALVFGLSIVLQHLSIAQNTTLDSLHAVLKTSAEDTNKANTISLISYELLNVNTDSAIIYANELRALSEKLNYSKGIASSYYRMGQVYNNLGDYGQSQSNFSK